MTRFPCGERLGGGELEPDPLGLGFLMSDVGDGGSSWVLGIPSRSLIVRLVMRRTSGSTTGDPPPLSVAGILEASCCWLMPGVHQLDPTAANRVMPLDGPIKCQRSIALLGL
jgi:hypothetical protein